jgi:hypothetical protein
VRSNHGNQQSPQDRRRSSATLSPTPPCCPRALSSPTFASDVLRRLARARPCAPLLPWSLVREDDRWPSPGVTRSEPHSGTGNVSPPADRSGASGWNAHPAEQTSPPLVWTGQLSASNASGRPGTLAAPRSVSHGARFHSSAAATRCGLHTRARPGAVRLRRRCGGGYTLRNGPGVARKCGRGPLRQGLVWSHRLAWRRARLASHLAPARWPARARSQSGRPAVVPSGKQLTRVGASSWTRAALTVH